MVSLADLRVGLGLDRHRLAKGLPLVLAGVTIDSSERGPEAHSDGDVLVHALIDALLGACGLGDIGEHFPPSDVQWANASGEALLKGTLQLVREAYPAFQVINVDATIHLEAPKLKPYKFPVRETLAKWLDLPISCVSVKAKTGEKLPPVGTLEAIDAQVAVLLTLNASC